MAEAIIISALLPLVFEKSVSLIEQQLGIVLGADVESELGKLQSTLSTIQAVLEDAEEKQVTDKALRLWLSNLKDAAYQADDLLEDFNLTVMERRQEARDHHKIVAKVLRFFSCGSNPLLFRPRMCRQIRDIVKRFDSLAEGRSKFHLREGVMLIGPTRTERRPTHSYVPESEVVGREHDVKGIVELLISQEHEKNVAVLPIVGMGGLGKTTLAQMVYNHPSMMEHFELRVWSSVTHDFSAAKVAKDMIETSSGSGFGLSDMDSLQRNLRKLIGAKRYLLVLDDVWNEDPQRWEEVKVMLTFGAQGSAVVVTTRSGIASSIMGTLDTYSLEQLSEDDCWILFSRRAFAGREEKPNLVTIGRAIVKKCGRLPLAANALGGLMHLKSEEREWRSVMESEIWDLPLGPSGIRPALLLSYYNLPSQLKQCFAFCAIFPRGYNIEKETLTKLWMGNGFMSDATMTLDTELKGDEIFRELEQRSFFQDVKEGSRWYDCKRITACRMHDLIHDLARSVMGKECRILDKWEEDSTYDRGSRHLFVNCEGGNPTASSKEKRTRLGTTGTTLRTLLFRGKLSDLMIASWSEAKYLRVLGLHNTGLSEFPISICDLRHLRYLDLSHNDIQALPEAISKLFNLQTLNLSACGLLLGLPKSISQMRSLMHLYLEGCMSLRSMPTGLGQLRLLQTLTRYVVGDEAGSGSIAELKVLNLHDMLELYNLKNVENVRDAEEANLSSKGNMQQLDLDWGESDVKSETGIAEEVLEALQPHPNLKQLAIRRYKGVKYPTWLMPVDSLMLLSNLVEIFLAGCSRCEHLPQLWQLPYLEVLEIGGMEPLKKFGGGVFPSLRRLKLYEMPNLEEWSGGVDEGQPYFARIAEIEIIDCPVLRIMPALPSARSLRITKCPLLHPAKGFFGCMESLERLDMDSCDDVVLMLEHEDKPGGNSLQYLQIQNCEKMMFSSPSLGLWKHFSSLQNLEIKNCKGIVILPVELFQGLTSLKMLVIHCCYYLVGSYLEDAYAAVAGGVANAAAARAARAAAAARAYIAAAAAAADDDDDNGGGGGEGEDDDDNGGGGGGGEGEDDDGGGGGGMSFRGLAALEDLNFQVCTTFPCFHPEGLRHLTALKTLRIYSSHGLTELPEFPDSVREVTFYNNWHLLSLPEGLGRLSSLENLVILNHNRLTSLPEEVKGYKALKSFKIEDCRRVTSFPVGLQRRLPSLKYLEIKDCPDLERLCSLGGEYWNLVSRIPVKYMLEVWREPDILLVGWRDLLDVIGRHTKKPQMNLIFT